MIIDDIQQNGYEFPDWESMSEQDIMRFFAEKNDPDYLTAAMERSTRVRDIMWESVREDNGECESCGS